MLIIRASRTAEVVRIAAATGHHAVMIDLEHSAMPVDVAAQLCATAGDLGLTPFVRVPERDYGIVGRLLDGGAQGIVAPRVETAAEAEAIVAAARFPPRGHRSAIAMVPGLGTRPTPAATLNPALDAQTIVQIMVETPAGIEHADAIAALDGVDMLALGANDLTAELGVPGDYDHPALREAVVAVAEACARHGKLFMLGGTREASLFALGACSLRLTGTDSELLYSAARQRVEALS